jgi:hypothetical protein
VLPFECGGDRPWLGGRAASETCGGQLKLLVRTASDAYFAQVVTALRLPEPDPDPLTLRIAEKDVWTILQHVTTLDQLRTFGVVPRIASAIEGVSLERALAAIEAERSAEHGQVERPLRSAEYERLTHAPKEILGVLAPQGVKFAAFEIPKDRADLPPQIARLVTVPELREVRVQISFSRFSSISANLQGEYDFSKYKVQPAVLTLPTGNEKWLPAAEVRGEGIFFELDLDAVIDWETSDAVSKREDILKQAFAADGQNGDFPGIRFYLLHSLSHLLLTAISLECGYAASSIRERLYCEPATSKDKKGMAGILLSTGTTGSEGTLGGLVEEGRRLRHHLREAWDLGRLCSNDPVCAAHNPIAEASDRRLEGRRLPRLPLRRRELVRALQPLPRPRPGGPDHRQRPRPRLLRSPPVTQRPQERLHRRLPLRRPHPAPPPRRRHRRPRPSTSPSSSTSAPLAKAPATIGSAPRSPSSSARSGPSTPPRPRVYVDPPHRRLQPRPQRPQRRLLRLDARQSRRHRR